MNVWRRDWALLLVSYFTAIQIIAIVWTAQPSLQLQTLFDAAIVPLIQTAALRITGAWAGYFLSWVVCAVVLLAVTTITGLMVFRNLPLTDAAFVALLFVPAIQAASLTLSAATLRAFARRVRETFAAPLAGPVVWIDLVVIPAGLIWLNHPAIGIATAGVLQRRWMATKLMAAAIALAFSPGRRDPRCVAAAAALALVATNEFMPWVLAATQSLPAPIRDQPPVLLWLAIDAIAIIAVVVLIRGSADALRRAAPAPAAAFDGAAVAIFMAGLALLVNAFLSLQPVKPWAGVALAFATLGSTLLAGGAIAATRR